MVIRWFIGLVLLCWSLVAQGRAYTYEAINEQSRSSKEYSLNTQDLAKNTKSQAYINNIIDEFQEGSPIPQYITACMGNVHEQQLENAGYELRDPLVRASPSGASVSLVLQTRQRPLHYLSIQIYSKTLNLATWLIVG